MQQLSLRQKFPNTELFLVRIFLYLDWIRRDTPYLSVYIANIEKYGPEITPFLDTFHTAFTKKKLQHRCFPVKFAHFWEHHFFTEHLQWLILCLSGRPMLCKLNWYVGTPAEVFSCEFCEIFFKTLLITSGGYFFLWQ